MTTRGPVLPSREDPVTRAGSEGLGGPAGHHVRPAAGWWTPVRVCLALATIVFALGVLQRDYCRDIGWPRDAQQYIHVCYSDLPHLYRERGLAEGDGIFDATKDHPVLEYPVLTGALASGTATLARTTANGVQAQAVRFFDINALVLGLFALVTVAATAKLAGRRPWDAAMVALAPPLALAATINWDLFAVGLTSLAMLAWARWRPGLAGILFGLAIAAKLYPVLLLGPLFLLCVRAGRLRPFLLTTVMAAIAWLAVNAPAMLTAPQAWRAFYRFNEQRGADFGSIWFVIDRLGYPVTELNKAITVLAIVGYLAVVLLAFIAPRRPRLPQLAFLVLAVFVLVNKVYSPQYVLWLIPLAVLARPRWRDFLIWQVGEVIYYFAIWYYLAGGYNADHSLPLTGYFWAIGVHVAATGWFASRIVRDVLRPWHDPVRADGSDDPAGGVLDGAADLFGRRRPSLGISR